MRGNNVVGIIFSNMHDDALREVTSIRTFGSIPFGGRYRTIDFPLSNMVNSGVNKVGVITKSNYQSLMDHLGSGKAWDLSRKREGLFILPPFGNGNSMYSNRIEALDGISNFLRNCNEEYVILADCDMICNLDFKKVIDAHLDNNADITIVYHHSDMPTGLTEPVVLELNGQGKVTDIVAGVNKDDKCDWGMGIYVMRKDFLQKNISDAISRNRNNFVRDILQRGVLESKIYGYRFDGYVSAIDGMRSYFNANMDLMSIDVLKDLFNPMRPIYTKVRDEMPAKYGLGSVVRNSMIADGCVIEGEVENCVLFRGVRVGKGAKLSNCIVMQDTVIGDNTVLEYVVSDKDVVFSDGKTMIGADSYPIYVAKGSRV